MTWHFKYIDRGKQQKFNDAKDFGISVVRDFLPAGNPYFETIVVHKLLPHENAGQQNLFLEAIGLDGKRLPVTFEVTNVNGFKSYPRTDKGREEPGTNVPIWMQDTLMVKVSGVNSDIVTGIHTRHKDEGGGNHRGHFSFLVVFQYHSGILEPNPDPEPSTPIKLREILSLDEIDAIRNFPLQKLKELVE